ncbi:ABC transporter ATP-binding protein [Paenibacillus bovis]|uniref:Dipeptide/oligopeptide/nickel ABC transporter ATP-binding protein n=1 Tax=Paenibacillus bovis TaxID=1616788 RepID=A0A172ZDD6_9BACL|nr:dipeptide/oligopeptide/nickel ABC transporter ATP-binding protein [Paenibacillus bovis]ANF95666.1 dipeptide/oligopeptide/nickel ABC transporter ATP-binding protein [Paenibacillus bovis]
MSLLQVDRLNKSYAPDKRVLNEVSFAIESGECLGLVGESGCGKSTLARCLLRIESTDSGSIVLDGHSIEKMNDHQLYPHRRNMQIVFQNPSAALNPKLKIRDSLLDPYRQYRQELRLQHFQPSSEQHLIKQLLEAVELSDTLADRYPHELSGGQRQRVTIARAISIEPQLVVLDEPTASLDVISQGAVLHLLTRLRTELNLSYLFISHDLAAVHQMSQRIMVMKDGQLVDQFPQTALFAEERHAYTRELISIF